MIKSEVGAWPLEWWVLERSLMRAEAAQPRATPKQLDEIETLLQTCRDHDDMDAQRQRVWVDSERRWRVLCIVAKHKYHAMGNATDTLNQQQRQQGEKSLRMLRQAHVELVQTEAVARETVQHLTLQCENVDDARRKLHEVYFDLDKSNEKLSAMQRRRWWPF